MITNRDELNKKKSAIMKSIMRDPKLSKILKDSLSSPLGSTKREYARSVISIMKKVGGMRYDGQGGMGSGSAGMIQPYASPRLFIFPAAPAFKKRDGKGGPALSTNDPSKLTVSGGTYTPFPTLTSPTTLSGMTIPPSSVPVQKGTPVPGSEKLTYSRGSTALPPATTPPGSFNGVNIRQFEPGYNILDELYKPGGALSGTVQARIAGYSKPAVESTIPTPVQPPSPTGGQQYQGPIGPQTQPAEEPGEDTKKSPTDAYSGVRGAVQQGIGPAAFALGTMGTPGAAEKALGLPAGSVSTGSLTDQINTINEALRKEHQIDSLQNQLINMKSRGMTVERDLANYVKGRDEYVGHLDSLIDAATDSMKDMDLTAPGVAQSMNTYMNYLYTLKGRQNQRYIDFVKQSRNEFDREYETLQDKYTNAYQQYQNALQLKTGLTQDEYGRIYNALSDLYTSLEEAPKKALETQVLEAQLIKIYSDAANSTGRSDADYWKDIKEYQGFYVDDKGSMLPNVNLTNAITQVASTGKDPAGAVQLFTGAMVKDISDKTASGVLGEAIKSARQYIDQISELSQAGGGTAAIGMGSTVANSGSEAIKQYVSQNENAVKSVLKEMVDSLKSKKIPSREKFISDNKDVVDPELLGDIYDYVKVNVGPNPQIDPNLLFTSSGKVSSATPEVIGNRLGGGISELWKAQITNASVRQ